MAFDLPQRLANPDRVRARPRTDGLPKFTSPPPAEVAARRAARAAKLADSNPVSIAETL